MAYFILFKIVTLWSVSTERVRFFLDIKCVFDTKPNQLLGNESHKTFYLPIS